MMLIFAYRYTARNAVTAGKSKLNQNFYFQRRRLIECRTSTVTHTSLTLLFPFVFALTYTEISSTCLSSKCDFIKTALLLTFRLCPSLAQLPFLCPDISRSSSRINTVRTREFTRVIHPHAGPYFSRCLISIEQRASEIEGQSYQMWNFNCLFTYAIVW